MVENVVLFSRMLLLLLLCLGVVPKCVWGKPCSLESSAVAIACKNPVPGVSGRVFRKKGEYKGRLKDLQDIVKSEKGFYTHSNNVTHPWLPPTIQTKPPSQTHTKSTSGLHNKLQILFFPIPGNATFNQLGLLVKRFNQTKLFQEIGTDRSE